MQADRMARDRGGAGVIKPEDVKQGGWYLCRETRWTMNAPLMVMQAHRGILCCYQRRLSVDDGYLDIILELDLEALARQAEHEQANREAMARGECITCGYAPCMCDQQ